MALPTLGQIGAQTARSTVKAVTDPAKAVARQTVTPITKVTAPIKSFLDSAAGGKGGDGKKIVKNTGNSNGLLGRIAVATEKTVDLLKLLVKGQTDSAKRRMLDRKANAMNTTLDVAGPTAPKQKDNEKDATATKKMSLMGKLLLAGAVISSVLENLDTEIGKFKAGWGTITLAISGLTLVAIPKILKAIAILKAAKIAYATFMQKEFVQKTVETLKTITGKILSPVMKAMKLLKAGFLVFKGFMLTTFVPAIVGTLTGLATALAPVLVAAAPFVAIGLALGAAFLGVKLLLEKVTDSLGFESIGQSLMYGVYKLKDGMAAIANFFLGIYNKIVGFVKDVVNSLPEKLVPASVREFAKNNEAGTAEMLSTNNAEEYRKAVVKEQKEKQPDATPAPPEATSAPTPDATQAPSNVVTREEFDERRKEQLRRKEANQGLSTREENELRQINRREAQTGDLEEYIKKQQNKVPAQQVQPPAGMAGGKVTVNNYIDQSNNSKTASQTNSFNPMGVGAPAGI
jgi:hypothetical protein